MLRIFSEELMDPNNFVVTLELVPGRESFGRNTDSLVGIAKDAFADGRISAVSITDNPGGNPSLSPDVLGYEIFKQGLDVIVHFTCRDMNRVGMESRALQLARMGMKSILCLTGDYSGKGFEGRGAPVFDLDSVLLNRMIQGLTHRMLASGDPEPFFAGCGVSPFKTLKSECLAQYKKLDRKIEAGAGFVITQLGYDMNKFNELIRYHKEKNAHVPVMASVYVLNPGAARAMNKGFVPGAFVSDELCRQVVAEYKDREDGKKAAIERAARMGVVLKGLGYRGIHIGGIHKDFNMVGAILNRMEEIEDRWPDYLSDFSTRKKGTYYHYDITENTSQGPAKDTPRLKERLTEHLPYRVLRTAHGLFFDKKNPLAPLYKTFARCLDDHNKGWILKRCLEDPMKMALLSCQGCGDCGIQHLGFLCPESGCPKHTRNGPCGGSCDGFCEVYPDRHCVWVRAYHRLKHANRLETFIADKVPPRNWELNKTSSWINFHLNRDHQKLP